MFRQFSKQSVWLVALLAVFVLSACAGQATAPTATTKPVVSEPTAVPVEPTATLVEPTATTEPVATLAEATATIEAATATPAEAVVAVSFASDVLPILQASCFNCHGGDKTQKGFDVSSYASVMAGSENGAVVVAGDANGSKLFTLVESGKMPKRGEKLTAEQVQLIQNWINAGALDN